MDMKRFLRISWTVQGSLIFAICMATLFIFPERIDGLVKLLPYLTGGWVLEGVAAAGGSSLKRVTEATLEKAKTGGKT